MTRLTIVLVLLAACARVGAGQASIVPATHPVYDWLLHQRVAGRLPTYQHEVRPMSRATIGGHLRTLAATSEGLASSDRRLLTDFRNEFEMDRLIANRGWTRAFVGGLPGSIPRAIRQRRDPVLVAAMSTDSLISGALYATVGAGFLALREPSRTLSSYATFKGVRWFLNTSFGLGWHFEWDNIWAANNRELVQEIPRYDTNELQAGSTSSHEHETYLSYRAGPRFEALAGWGGWGMGASVTDPLLLRADGPTFSSVRLQIGGPKLNLVFLHGALKSTTTTDTSGTVLLPVYNRYAPERFFVSQRLTWMPFPRLSLAAHEQTIYTNRGVDLNYVNPAGVVLLSQGRLGDRDNLMIGGDGVFRPWSGTELLGSFVLDDRSAPDPEADSFGPFKKAVLVGVEQRVLTGVRLGLSYTEADPWTYTHWLRVNTYESEGKPLGPVMGPNSEEFAARVTTWLPLRTRVMAGYRRIKRGLDPAGASVDISKCVGGNLFCGTLGKEAPLYKGADVHVIARVELEALSEPIRGMPITLSVRDDRVMSGTQLRSTRFVDLRFRFGY